MAPTMIVTLQAGEQRQGQEASAIRRQDHPVEVLPTRRRVQVHPQGDGGRVKHTTRSHCRTEESQRHPRHQHTAAAYRQTLVLTL